MKPKTKNTAQPNYHLYPQKSPYWHLEVPVSNSKVGKYFLVFFFKFTLYPITMKMKMKGRISAKIPLPTTIFFIGF